MAAQNVDYLLIGGGLASANAAQTLREEGADGQIMLVAREPEVPYERPPCSKGYLQGAQRREEAFVLEADWYEQNDVQLLTRTSVTALDAQTRTAKLSTREEVSFEKALIATGANVRRLNVPGCELEGIHYLRTLANADAIREELADVDEVVLIGGSYIGCEVAASLTMMGKRCTIVMQEQLTLQRGFGEQAGRFFQQILTDHGITVHGGDELERFEGDGTVARVITRGGLELAAQMVVIGAGVSPDITLARSAGLELDDERGGVLCDERLSTSAAGIWAAGDVASYHSVPNGRRIRIEHWDVAVNHGKTAALNMLGRDILHEVVPYFFSDLADWGWLEYVGPAQQWDQEIVRGSIEQGAFSNWYLRDGGVQGVLSVERSDDLEHARRLIAAGTVLDDRQQAALGDLDSDLDTVGR